jgi:hypothetical protein
MAREIGPDGRRAAADGAVPLRDGGRGGRRAARRGAPPPRDRAGGKPQMRARQPAAGRPGQGRRQAGEGDRAMEAHRVAGPAYLALAGSASPRRTAIRAGRRGRAPARRATSSANPRSTCSTPCSR